MALSEKHPRYGYRRITALLRLDGLTINPKRVQRLRRMEGLQGTGKSRSACDAWARSRANACARSKPRQVWSWDFVEDQTENGTRFRILTLLDEFTRQSLAVHAA